jgi:hypothetical protein
MANDKKQHELGDLRELMFDQMKRLADPNCDLEKELKRSTAIVDVGKTLIDSAKVEVEFVKATNSIGSGFIPNRKSVNENGNGKLLGDGIKHS